MKKAGFALGGGGVRGVAHIAYLEALGELRIKPSIISGTSSGAIIGALYASGINPADMFGMLTDIFKSKKRAAASLLRAKNKSGLVASFAKDSLTRLIPKKRFEQLDIPLKIVATNFHTLEEMVFDKGEILPALMCSIAFPGVFAPQSVDGSYYVDGGATNIVPFDIIRSECDVLIAIDVSRVRPNSFSATAANAVRVSWAATHQALMDYKLNICPVDVFERPDFGPVGTMEFQKSREIYNKAQTNKPAFIQKIKMAMEKE